MAHTCLFTFALILSPFFAPVTASEPSCAAGHAQDCKAPNAAQALLQSDVDSVELLQTVKAVVKDGNGKNLQLSSSEWCLGKSDKPVRVSPAKRECDIPQSVKINGIEVGNLPKISPPDVLDKPCAPLPACPPSRVLAGPYGSRVMQRFQYHKQKQGYMSACTPVPDVVRSIEIANCRVSLYDDSSCTRKSGSYGGVVGGPPTHAAIRDDKPAGYYTIDFCADPCSTSSSMLQDSQTVADELEAELQDKQTVADELEAELQDNQTEADELISAIASMTQDSQTEADELKAGTKGMKLIQKIKAGMKRLDINQKAYIENSAVLGDGAGQGNLNVCMELADYFVNNPNSPDIKVCGTGIKATVYLLGRCGEGSLTAAKMAHTWEVGSCDTGAPPSTCCSMGPSSDKRLGAAQSYKITQC